MPADIYLWPVADSSVHAFLVIYTTKIDTFVCLPNISETVSVTIMKLAHRTRIDSTTITLISKSILLSFLSILFKTIQPISAGPNPYTSTDTCLPRERSVAMTTSSSSRPVKLQRRVVKDRRQLTLSSDFRFRDRMFPFLATELVTKYLGFTRRSGVWQLSRQKQPSANQFSTLYVLRFSHHFLNCRPHTIQYNTIQ